MTEDNARSIIEFLIKNQNAENFMVHCKAGQSRSAAVGAVMMELFNNDESPVWNNPYMLPNRWCYYFLKLQIKMRLQNIEKTTNPFNIKNMHELNYNDEDMYWCYIHMPQYTGYGLILKPNDDSSIRLNDGLYGTGFSVKVKKIKKNQLFLLPPIKRRDNY